MFRFFAGLIATVLTVAALVRPSTAQTTIINSPVAYVYVSTPTYAVGYSVAPNGRLTPVPGSPYTNIALSHMSVAKSFLLGSGHDQENLHSYRIHPDGSLTRVDTYNVRGYDDCAKMGPTQVDRTGSTLYLSQFNCPIQMAGDYFNIYNFQAWKVANDGTLEFLGNTPLNEELMNTNQVSPLYFLGDNKYGLQIGCIPYFYEGLFASYQRESGGALDESLAFEESLQQPAAPSEERYCGNFLATDDANHAAVELAVSTSTEGYGQNLGVLASYTADSHGNLTTLDTSETAAKVNVGLVAAMSISPAGNLLAVGGYHGFQIFHFNGALPITHYSSVLQSTNHFEEFGWDKSNHLFAVSTDGLRVYNITPLGYSEAPGSPVPISGATSVIVVPLR
jgi:6-phosphogluconolactonase (cycloisomerase 2 family)